MKVLVTGGAGFIGFHVAKALVERGDQVVVIDNLNDYYETKIKHDRLKELGNSVIFYQADIGDMQALRKIFQKHNFDKVCHLAAQAGVRYSIENPFTYHHSNGLGTLNILELMKEFDIKDLVFASSSSVYGGNTKVPFNHGDQVDTPVSFYAATKKYKELMAHAYHKLYGMNIFALRFFTVYGPWGRPDMAYYKFSKLIRSNQPIPVFNNGNHERDFTYITDIVDGVLLALDKVKGYELLNLGNNNTVHLMDFIKTLEKHLGQEAEKNMLPLQKGDVHRTFADIEHSKKILGWEPKTNVDQGLQQFVEWFNQYHQE